MPAFWLAQRICSIIPMYVYSRRRGLRRCGGRRMQMRSRTNTTHAAPLTCVRNGCIMHTYEMRQRRDAPASRYLSPFHLLKHVP